MQAVALWRITLGVGGLVGSLVMGGFFARLQG
uniref:Uncharacterized protein n=1 Tax=Cyanothece sp. (strain PCC 7425 / ATCC 29141) TaxID=395961 RepID=B8HKP1_CYAP4